MVFGGEGMQPDTEIHPYGHVSMSGWREGFGSLLYMKNVPATAGFLCLGC